MLISFLYRHWTYRHYRHCAQSLNWWENLDLSIITSQSCNLTADAPPPQAGCLAVGDYNPEAGRRVPGVSSSIPDPHTTCSAGPLKVKPFDSFFSHSDIGIHESLQGIWFIQTPDSKQTQPQGIHPTNRLQIVVPCLKYRSLSWKYSWI